MVLDFAKNLPISSGRLAVKGTLQAGGTHATYDPLFITTQYCADSSQRTGARREAFERPQRTKGMMHKLCPTFVVARRSHLVRALSSARSKFRPCLFEAFLPSGMIALFCSVRLPLRSMLEHACCSKKKFSKK